MRRSAGELVDAFMAAHGATCCRVLSRRVRHDPKAHFAHCAELTAGAAEMAARLVLARRPGLADRAKGKHLFGRPSRLGAGLLRLFRFFLF
jgi:hypothetical protein